MDESAVTSSITSMTRNTFSEEFFNQRLERTRFRKGKGGECNIGCLETAIEWGGVVRLGEGNVLKLYAGKPVVGCFLSFSNPLRI